MKYVEVYSTDVERETQELWFTVTLDDNDVIDLSEVPKSMREMWEKYGIPFRGERRMPDDGEIFLEAVSHDLKGSMVRSEKIMEE